MLVRLNTRNKYDHYRIFFRAVTFGSQVDYGWIIPVSPYPRVHTTVRGYWEEWFLFIRIIDNSDLWWYREEKELGAGLYIKKRDE
jgi:hypothetical protein